MNYKRVLTAVLKRNLVSNITLNSFMKRVHEMFCLCYRSFFFFFFFLLFVSN